MAASNVAAGHRIFGLSAGRRSQVGKGLRRCMHLGTQETDQQDRDAQPLHVPLEEHNYQKNATADGLYRQVGKSPKLELRARKVEG